MTPLESIDEAWLIITSTASVEMFLPRLNEDQVKRMIDTL